MNVRLPVILWLLRLGILGRLGILRLARFGILGRMGILRIGRLFLLLGRGPPLRDTLVIALVNAVGQPAKILCQCLDGFRINRGCAKEVVPLEHQDHAIVDSVRFQPHLAGGR